MSYSFLLSETKDQVNTLTLNRPKANALSREMIIELREAVEAAIADAAVRVIVITGGEGKFFAAGADIPTLRDSLANPLAEGTMLGEGLKTMEAIERSPKPVIASVNGIALGGGCEIALACHVRIAADTAVFGQPEILLGVIPGWGGTHRLPRVVGHGWATEWLLTGRQVSASEALAAGLVTRVVPAAELGKTTHDFAVSLAGKPAVALAQTLHCLYHNALYPERGVALEAEAFLRTAQTEDAMEGTTAFIEKRTARFKGR